MGEIAEMMLDGTLCEACGTVIDMDDAPGFPRYCSPRCARDRGALPECALKPKVRQPANPASVKCPTCLKRVKKTGLADHILAMHPRTRA